MGKILEVQTEHVIPIKILFEVLKEMLPDAVIDFRRDDNMQQQNNIANKPKIDNTEERKENNNETESSSSDKEILDESEKKNKVKKPDIKNAKNSKTTEIDNKIKTLAEVAPKNIKKTANAKEDDVTALITATANMAVTTVKENVKSTEVVVQKEEKKVQNSNGGIRIMAVDPSKTVLINLRLYSSEFSEFKCKPQKLELGVNLQIFNKLIKSMDKDDILTLFVDEDDEQHLGIQIDNQEKKCKTLNKLKLMDLDSQSLRVPPTLFDAQITMPSSDLHKLCRDMCHIAEYVEIKCASKSITFSCKGDCAERSVTYSVNEKGISIKHSNGGTKNKPNIVQGIFELRNLILFTKCSNLCNDIIIFMKNNYPLVIKYTVATLGHILLCLTPIAEKEEKESYSDEDGLYSDDDVDLKDNDDD